MSLNKVMIIGNLGRDPEMRYTPSGQAVTQFTVATNRSYQDKNQEWQKETEWHRVVVWGQQAERAAERLRKGNRVYVEGRLQTRQWEDQSGGKRSTTEIIAQHFENLERKDREDGAPWPDEGEQGGHEPRGNGNGNGNNRSARPASRPSQAPASPPASTEDFDDLPF